MVIKKVADVSPIFKKDESQKSKNYRLVSVLPVVSQVFERPLHKQMALHVEEYLPPYLRGYRKVFSTQQALLSLLERWKNVSEKRDMVEQH